MLVLSNDPEAATQQMLGVIFYLATAAYVDGHLDPTEEDFIRGYIRRMLQVRSQELVGQIAPERLAASIERHAQHFDSVLQETLGEIRELWTESVSRDEGREDFVQARLKVRCFEVFKSFDDAGQRALMDAVDELFDADEHLHAAERRLRQELLDILATGQASPAPVTPPDPEHVRVGDALVLGIDGPASAALGKRVEEHLAGDGRRLAKQVAADRKRLRKVIALLDKKRKAGAGRLAGKQRVRELAGQGELLDGHVHLVAPTPGQEYELTVVGDLHGCYSCLKAAVVQSRFEERVAAHKKNPKAHPIPRLVLLGDYLDRGRFGFDGVLRGVLELLVTYPDHVYVLRGNHEWYVDQGGKFLPGVMPAESYLRLAPHVGDDDLGAYYDLFESLPTMLLFDQLVFVHGGPPPDRLLKDKHTDLASLNDWYLRFYMLWGDPSPVTVIPTELQDQKTARFAYGQLQYEGFMEHIGAHTMIRGHQMVKEGFRQHYGGAMPLYTVFSAGGVDNDDLPERSAYRGVVPKALTLRYRDGKTLIKPWVIDYKPFNAPERNGLYASPQELFPIS